MPKKRLQKIDSLQALRALAFIGIFLAHVHIPYNWSGLGVSIFFTLSGFLLMYRHSGETNCHFTYAAKYSIKKISRIYPLHLITMVGAALIYLTPHLLKGTTANYLPELLRNLFLNLFLIQSWVPNSVINVSLNGVAWFLSSILFLYFCFPYIAKWAKNKSNKTLLSASLIAIILSIILCIPWMLYVDKNNHAFIWFSYCFPLFRLLDFFCGCCLGQILAKKEPNHETLFKGTLYEVITISLTIGALFYIQKAEPQSLLLQALQNYTSLYVPLSLLFIYLFLKPRGILTKALSNKALIYIGNISSMAFLIHYVVTIGTDAALSFLKLNLSPVKTYGLILFQFALTILLSIAYKQIEAKVLKPKLKKL